MNTSIVLQCEKNAIALPLYTPLRTLIPLNTRSITVASFFKPMRGVQSQGRVDLPKNVRIVVLCRAIRFPSGKISSAGLCIL